MQFMQQLIIESISKHNKPVEYGFQFWRNASIQ